jgi:hypothetical protein
LSPRIKLKDICKICEAYGKVVDISYRTYS